MPNRKDAFKPKGPKTTKEVSFVTGTSRKEIDAGIDAFIKSLYIDKNKDTARKFLKDLKNIAATDKERLKITQDLLKATAQFENSYKVQKKDVEAVKKQLREVLSEAEAYEKSIAKANKVVAAKKEVWGEVKKVLKGVHSEAEKIYKTSHQMQLEANLTWGEFTKLYDSAYEQARRMNVETGKSIHNARELVETQNKLLLEGWRGLDTTTVANLSSQVMLMQKTLGAFPQELNNAFQLSYRTLGEKNNEFVTALGNRLNAFQDTFGTSLGMFTNLITTLMNSNSFIAKENVNAQIRANESLIKAAALAGQIGIMSQNFISELAMITQYGTMEQMSTLYQGGALLQGFDVSGFQQQMLDMDYYGATSSLLESIYSTLNNIDDHYLRAEYMQQIGGAFGITQQDLLAIMNSGGKIEELNQDIMDKLTNVETSMVEELRGLKVDLLDRMENFFNNTKVAQGYGKIMSDLGLFGISGHLNTIKALLVLGMSKDSLGGALGGALKGMFAGGGFNWGAAGTVGGTGAPGVMPMIGRTALGLGGGIMAISSNLNAYNSISNTSQNQSTTGSWISNLLQSTAGGAMVGTAMTPGVGTLVGAGVGLATGIVTGIVAEGERGKKAQAELDAQARREGRALRDQEQELIQTGDPAMDALIVEVREFRNVVSEQLNDSMKFQVTTRMYDKTTTEGT